MGVISNVKTAFGYGVARPDYLASPFTEGQLQQIVWSDVFGADFAPVSRADALAVAPLLKARNLICGTVGKFPLVAKDKSGVLPPEKQPNWLYRTDGAISPFLRMVYTCDDLLFYGHSLWLRENGADGFPIKVERLPYTSWHVDAEQRIVLKTADGERLADDSEIIYFPNFAGGLLDTSAASIRAAVNISQTIEQRAKTPVPIMEIHATGDAQDTPSAAQAKEYVKQYNAARRDPEGATVYTPPNVQLISHGDKAESGFMVQAQNSVRLNMANITGIPAAILDGSTSSASLTYSTREGQRNEFLDSLSTWMDTIAGRLSANDIGPNGQSIAFDLTDALSVLPLPTGLDKQD